MSTHLLYLSQIRTAIPNVVFERIEQTAGQFNDVVSVNDDWIFRFPRYREGVAQMIAETRLLDALRGRLPLPIPDPVHKRFDPPVPGLAFLGYKRIPGEPFTRESLAQVSDEWVRDDLAAQLAGFLRTLHAVEPTSLEGQVTPSRTPAWHSAPTVRAGSYSGPVVSPRVQDGRDDWERMYADVREKLFPAMRVDARREVTALYESYLDDRALQTFIPALRHGDFGGGNILWDPRQGRVTGVVDFSFCALGDPAMDLASVSTLGSDLFERLTPRYETDAAKRAALLARARFYRSTFALMEALDGQRDGNQEAFQHGMEGYV